MKMPVPTEKEILKSCLALLSARGVFAWRVNVGATALEFDGKKRLVRYGKPGQSDIAGILPSGRFICIETKRPRNRPTPLQIAWMREVIQHKGVAFWVTSAKMLDQLLNHIVHGGTITVEETGDMVLS